MLPGDPQQTCRSQSLQSRHLFQRTVAYRGRNPLGEGHPGAVVFSSYYLDPRTSTKTK